MKILYSFLQNNPNKLFIGILAFQLVLMLIMSFDVGISADEKRHYLQAEKVYNYYKSGGDDISALSNTGTDPMQYNGQSFDNVMFFMEKVFKIEKIMEFRHFFNALTGWLIILFAGLIARKFWGYKAAILTILLLFISPRFLGHALNNNKDIPFALGFILSTYGSLRFLTELPKIKKTTIVLLIIGIGASISIRVAGILSIGILGLFSGFKFLFKKPYFSFLNKEKLRILKKIVIILPIVSLVGYGLGILFWPFLFENPIKGFMEVLSATEEHPIALNQLFKGDIILSNNMPKNYILTYIFLTYPLFVFLGVILLFAFIPLKWKSEYKNLIVVLFLIFTTAFVILWMSLLNSNIYGGIRHILFIYPLLILLSVKGFILLQQYVSNSRHKIISYLPILLVILTSINPIKHLIKNYPYSYVYFNEVAGGVKNNYDKYETDYFQHSLKHASLWLFNSIQDNNQIIDSSIINIVTNDEFNTGYYLNKPNINVQYSRYYEKHKVNWDYGIFYCGYISPHQLRNNLWPPKGTIHTEEVDGFPIAAVVKRISDEDYKGFEALKTNKTVEAKKHFKSFLELYPENEEVLEGYARALLMERKPDSTIIYADSSILYNPRQIGAHFLKASAYNAKKDYEKANIVSDQTIAIKESFAEAHYQKGLALKGLNKPNEALKEFRVALAYKKDYYGSYMQVGDIFMNYKRYKDAIGSVYNKALELKPDDLLANANIAKCYHFLGDNKNAEAHLRKASEKGPRNFNVVKTGCRIEMKKGNLNGAAQLLNMARNINYDSELFVLRAMYVIKQDKAALAKQYLDKAIEIDNTNREAQELLKKFQVPSKPLAQTKQKTSKSVMFQSSTKTKAVNPLQPRQR